MLFGSLDAAAMPLNGLSQTAQTLQAVAAKPSSESTVTDGGSVKVEKAYYYYYRRHYWHPHYYHRYYYHPHYYHRYYYHPHYYHYYRPFY